MTEGRKLGGAISKVFTEAGNVGRPWFPNGCPVESAGESFTDINAWLPAPHVLI